jgi:hypothetical protein
MLRCRFINGRMRIGLLVLRVKEEDEVVLQVAPLLDEEIVLEGIPT